MQEEADPVRAPHGPQLGRKGNQMEIVDPDEIVGLKEWHQLLREQLVYPPIPGSKVDVEICQIEPVVKYWTPHIVGVPEIIRILVALTQVYRGQCHIADTMHAKILVFRGRLPFVTDFAAPAKP